MSGFGCDYAILTVVPEAMTAAEELFGAKPEDWQRQLGVDFPVVLVTAADEGQQIVVLHQAADRSNIPAFEATSLLLRAWRPRHLVLADIGGGFSGRDALQLGDVVVASDIGYYETVKQLPGGLTEERNNPIQLPAIGTRRALTSLPQRVPGWDLPARQFRPSEDPDGRPKILQGQVVAGEKLLSNPSASTVAALVKRYPKALALDMESAGTGRAVLSAQTEGVGAQLTVIRAISDFVDKKNASNQLARDNWKPYAARLAVVAARAWIINEPTDAGVIATGGGALAGASVVAAGGTRAARRPSDPFTTYLGELRTWLATNVLPPERSFPVTPHAVEYRSDKSVVRVEDAEVERGEVLDVVLAKRRVVLYGPSGAGKSVLLRQILRQLAPGDDPVVVLVDLKSGWNVDWGSRLVEAPDESNVDSSLNLLLAACPQRPTASKLRAMAAERRVVLLVDALNEVPAETGQRIREALEQYLRREDNVSVLITDRRVELFYRDYRWTALDLRGASINEARAVVEEAFGKGSYDTLSADDQRLLTVPFFLERALRSHKLNLGSRADAVREFLEGAGFEEEELTRVANIAFTVYGRGVTVLQPEDLTALSDGGLLKRLIDAEVLIEDDEGMIISHQLVHQYLVGRYLAARPEDWTGVMLDMVTAEAASLDVVGMTIAAIPEQHDRDQFLRIVYDWSWTAAVIALGETQSTSHAVSEALAIAILAMIAEKRFNAAQDTVARAEGLLRIVPGEFVREMLEVESSAQLYARVTSLDLTEATWWPHWKKVFLGLAPETSQSLRALADIASSEPLIGWATANALRRFVPTGQAPVVLRAIFWSQLRDDSASKATRWRIVHTLGAWPSQENAALLFEAFDDAYSWVVYGAVRSLVEMAARTDDATLRGEILDSLRANLTRLKPSARSTIAWVAPYDGADQGWPQAVRPLLNTARDEAAGLERDRWEEHLRRFDDYVASRHDID